MMKRKGGQGRWTYQCLYEHLGTSQLFRYGTVRERVLFSDELQIWQDGQCVLGLDKENCDIKRSNSQLK